MNSIKRHIIPLLKASVYLFLLYQCLAWVWQVLGITSWFSFWTPVVSEVLICLNILLASWLFGYILRICMRKSLVNIYWFDYLLIIINTIILVSINLYIVDNLSIELALIEVSGYDFIILSVPLLIMCGVFLRLRRKQKR